MRVLLGIGGSEDSFRALDTVVQRARDAGDDLTVAVLENPESTIDPDEVETRVGEALGEADLDAPVRRLEGDPGPRLVDVAEREGFDAIALGGGEQSPMGKITLGHIAEFVILNANATVILIR